MTSNTPPNTFWHANCRLLTDSSEDTPPLRPLNNRTYSTMTATATVTASRSPTATTTMSSNLRRTVRLESASFISSTLAEIARRRFPAQPAEHRAEARDAGHVAGVAGWQYGDGLRVPRWATAPARWTAPWHPDRRANQPALRPECGSRRVVIKRPWGPGLTRTHR